MTNQTSCYFSAVVEDLWVKTNLLESSSTAFRVFTGLTFSISLLVRMVARPFLKAMDPSSRISNRYTFFLVAI